MASFTSTVILFSCLLLQAYSISALDRPSVHQQNRPTSTYKTFKTRLASSKFGAARGATFKSAVTSKKERAPSFIIDLARRSFSRSQVTRSTQRSSVSVHITDGDLQGLETTARGAGICSGPGPGTGLAITPMQIFFSPPGVPTCTSAGPSGPPFPFLCRYGCGTFFLFGVPFCYCYFVCGSVGTAVVGFNGFSCRVNALQIPPFPGPLLAADVCSA